MIGIGEMGDWDTIPQTMDPLNEIGLCLLSLGTFLSFWVFQILTLLRFADGGGLRGLSALRILKCLMARINRERRFRR